MTAADVKRTESVVEAVVDGGAIGRITLNRPEAMNAITVALGEQLETALRTLAPQVRVIVLRGASGNFSVGGGDFHELQQLREQGRDAMSELFGNFGRACSAIAELDVPVIAAVEGYAMAGGFELMQSADIALVHAKAKLADTHSNHGMVPGGGSTQRLPPRLVGRQRALAHILTGDRLSADQAVAWGARLSRSAGGHVRCGCGRVCRSSGGQGPRCTRAQQATRLRGGFVCRWRTDCLWSIAPFSIISVRIRAAQALTNSPTRINEGARHD